jgi:hypothetical protein
MITVLLMAILLGPGITGDGISIGQNGKPTVKGMHLTRAQQKVLDEHLPAIRRAIRKDMSRHRRNACG